jgi:aquaporin rerated protein, invertebrate
MIGGYFGYALLRAVTPIEALESSGDAFCVTLPSVDNFKAFWIEFFMTMALIMICYGVWDPRNANHHDSVPLRFGLAISGLALVGVKQ